MANSLQYAVKFCMALFLLCVHLGLALLFLLSFIVHTGRSTEGIAIGVECVVIVILSIYLRNSFTKYRKMRSFNKARRPAFNDWVYCVSTLILSLANAIWITVQALTLTEAFAGLPRPDLAAIAAITLVWLAWTISLHLIWVMLQEHNAWMDGIDSDPEESIRWPSPPSTPFTPPAPRRHPYTRMGRVSAHIVAVQHGSPPEMWDQKNKANPRDREPLAALQPAKPTYDPKARQRVEPPPVQTSRQQWYVRPGPGYF